MRERRRDYLTSHTRLGRCYTRFDDLFTEFAHLSGNVSGYDTLEQALTALEDAIRTNDQACVVGTLFDIFDPIMDDFTYGHEKLPPLPPPYRLNVKR